MAGQPQRPFSLFDYRQTWSFGLSLSYLYYKENPDESEEIRDFTDYYGFPPRLRGAPKSTEYGTVYGLSWSTTIYSWQNKLLLRPRAALLLGIDNTYDGSTQAKLLPDDTGGVAGLEFYPVTFKKNNVYLSAGCDIGYVVPIVHFPFAFYTGLDFKLWYRDLTQLQETQGELYYNTDAGNSETYYWFNIPAGILITRPVLPRYVLGADASVGVLIFGGMQVAGVSSVNYPMVALGNRASCKLELFVQQRKDNGSSMRLTPYFEYYGFGKSNAAVAPDGTSFYEPSSDSFLFGLTLSWEFLGKMAG